MGKSALRKVVKGISIDTELLERLDRHWRQSGLRSRSEAIDEAVRQYLVEGSEDALETSA